MPNVYYKIIIDNEQVTFIINSQDKCHQPAGI